MNLTYLWHRLLLIGIACRLRVGVVLVMMGQLKCNLASKLFTILQCIIVFPFDVLRHCTIIQEE